MKNRLARPSAWTLWVTGLGGVILAGGVAGLMVFWKGLVITNLTDMVPWGLWITIDLCSIAVSAGAFSLCAAVYLLGLKRYQRLARTATFIGLIGYTMALLTLLMDIGRPDRFWHALVYWNRHSLLWEVTLCVTLYLAVLLCESLPIFAESAWLGRRWPKLALRMKATHHYAPYLAVAGLGLSMLHQSSLGAVYGVLKAHPLWYRPDVSVLFIISAVAGGMALTVLASMLAARCTRSANVDDSVLERASLIVGWILAAYLYFRFWDALSMTYTYEPGRTEGLRLLTSGPLAFNFWVSEMLLGTLVPMILLLNRKARSRPFWRMAALALVVLGVVTYRWDTNLSGQLVVLAYLPGSPAVAYTSYVPSMVEILSAAGVIGYGLLAFSLGVRHLRVVDHGVETERAEKPARQRVPEPAAAD